MKIKYFITTIVIFTIIFSINANAQTWIWADSIASQGLPSTSSSQPCLFNSAIAADSNGNIFNTGSFNSSQIKLGNFTLTNTSTKRAIYIAKYSSTGSVLWAKKIEESEDLYSTAICVSPNGDVAITGVFKSPTLTVGTNVFNNNSIADVNYGGVLHDIFILKYDTNGNFLWGKTIGGANSDYAYAITTDNHNNIYIAGGFSSATLNIGASVLNTNGNASSSMPFFAKYDMNGNALWAKTTAGSSGFYQWNRATSIAIDKSGNIIIGGNFASNTILFDNIILNSPNNSNYYWSHNIFVVKYNSSGNLLWAKSFGGIKDDELSALAIDTSENIVITGTFQEPINIGNIPISHSTNTDLFIAKLDKHGNAVWAKSHTGSGYYDQSSAISLDKSGNIVLVGFFESSSISFDNFTLYNNNAPNWGSAFIATYSANGNVVCANALSTRTNYKVNVCIHKSGDAIIAGEYNSYGGNVLTVGANTFPYVLPGSSTVYLARYNCNNTIGISEQNNISANSLAIYPNPNNGTFTLETKAEGTYSIINELGQTMKQVQLNSDNNFTMNFEGLATGIYFVVGYNNNQISRQKIVVTK